MKVTTLMSSTICSCQQEVGGNANTPEEVVAASVSWGKKQEPILFLIWLMILVVFKCPLPSHVFFMKGARKAVGQHGICICLEAWCTSHSNNKLPG